METHNKKHEDTVLYGCMQKGLKQNGSGLGKHTEKAQPRSLRTLHKHVENMQLYTEEV